MLNSNKDIILKKLKRKNNPFLGFRKPDNYLEMVPVTESDTETLWAQFAREAEKLSCKVCFCNDMNCVEEKLTEIIGEEDAVYCWTEENLPIKNFHKSIKQKNLQEIEDKAGIKIGISGASAAIASTGSVAIGSGKGRFRFVSLVPDIHIVLLKRDQIFSTFEIWLQFQRQNGMQDISNPSNVVLISGPSRTADIAMELVLGMHGPREVHILVIP